MPGPTNRGLWSSIDGHYNYKYQHSLRTAGHFRSTVKSYEETKSTNFVKGIIWDLHSFHCCSCKVNGNFLLLFLFLDKTSHMFCMDEIRRAEIVYVFRNIFRLQQCWKMD